MDNFENLLRTMLEQEGFWVRQSFKVNLTKQEKVAVGKHTIPRPEIDLLALNQAKNIVYVIEAKSFLDSTDVNLSEIDNKNELQQGKYKLFTSKKYREVVFNRLKIDLVAAEMATHDTKFVLGLAAGKVKRNQVGELEKYFSKRDWMLWTPKDIKEKLVRLADIGYENDMAIIAAKIILRDNS